MFGWIETGGFFAETTNEDIVFRTASGQQVIAIGNSDSNEAYNNAALYVRDNRIGVKCLPDSAYVLKVDGGVCLTNGIHDVIDASSQNRIQFDGSMMRFISQSNASSITFNCTDSSVKTETVNTKHVLTPKRMLTGVVIHTMVTTVYQESVDDPVKEAFEITVDGQYDSVFDELTTFIVRDRTFIVLKVDIINGGADLRLLIARYSSFYLGAPVFSAGDVVDVEILEDWTPVNMAAKKETLYYRFCVDQYEFSDLTPNPSTTLGVVPNAILDLKVYYHNKDHVLRETLEPDNLFILSRSRVTQQNGHPQAVLRLISYTTYEASNGQVGYHFRFKNVDGRSTLANNGLESYLTEVIAGQARTVLMFPLTTGKSLVENDDNAIVGYTIDAITNKICYQVVSPLLASYIYKYYGTSGIFRSYGVHSIVLGERALQFVNAIYKLDSEDTVVIDTIKVNDPIYNVTRQSIRYYFHGAPMRVVGVVRKAADIVDLVLTTNHEELLTYCHAYEGAYVSWFDFNQQAQLFGLNKMRKNVDGSFSCSLTMLNTTDGSNNLFDDARFYEAGRVAYFLPLKYTNHVRISDAYENTYVPYKLSIGRHFCHDAFDVVGDSSFHGKVNVYNTLDERNVRNKFQISYDDECVLNFNNQLRLTSSNAVFANDIETTGNVTGSAFLQYSDARLKTNILSSSSDDDLRRITQVNIRTFNLHGSGAVHKGVIAQELLNVFPEAVSTCKGVLPGFIGIVGYIDKSVGKMRVHGLSDKDVKEGDTLRVSAMKENKDSYRDLRVKSTNVVLVGDEYVTFIEFYEDLRELDYFVKILGVLDDVLRVNSDVLYMSAVNAIKELKREIDYLKKMVFG